MKVELHQAFVWDCDYCGHENFVRAITVEQDEVVSELREEMGVEPWLTGDVLTCPTEVVCHYCQARCEVETR